MATNPETQLTEEKEKTGVEKEISDLRREVIESRNLVIKTDNLLKNLFAELKTVSKRNDDTYRRTWISSAAAYGLFVVLAITVSFLASRGSVATERALTDQARRDAEIAHKQVTDLSARLASGKADVDQQRVASAKALAAYQILSDGKGEDRLKGIDALASVDRNLLSDLEKRALDDRASGIKVEVGQAAYERGKAAYRRQDMTSAVKELTRYLALDPQGDSFYAQFLLGTAQFQQRNYPEAARALETFVNGAGKGQRNVDYGLYVLGQSYEQLGNNDRAMQTYQRCLSELPASEYTANVQRRLRALKQVAQNGTPAATGAAQASAQPAAQPDSVAAPTDFPAAAPRAARATVQAAAPRAAQVTAQAAPKVAPASAPAVAPRIAPAVAPKAAPAIAPKAAPAEEPSLVPAPQGSASATHPAAASTPTQPGAAAPE